RAPARVDPGTLQLRPGELGDDRRELLDVFVADDDVGQAPPFAPSFELLDDLRLRSRAHGTRLERSFGPNAEHRRDRARESGAIFGDTGHEKAHLDLDVVDARAGRFAHPRDLAVGLLGQRVGGRCRVDLTVAQIRVDTDDVGFARRD